MIGPNGGIAQTLISSIEGISFKFINELDIDSSTGVIYFIDSSRTFYKRFLSRSSDSSGRVALSKNHSFSLVAKIIWRRISKFNLETNNFEPEVFAELPRVPNNIKMNHKGEFWVALNAGSLEEINDDVPDPIGIKYDQEGRILKQLDGNGKDVFSSISEINEIQPKILICNEKHLEAAIIESKRALIEEDREAIKASIERNGGISYETKRRSPGEPDLHHH
ncbi:hypothetical protein GOBAR_AA32484 [Gossypium barbadense]|uniref:Strictosidine synthase conserved region domain-containing protein n=1 Tax=Gossypium barbadense TaxID=3634 RepID=A0A2P5WAT5_GOSBA|nr:hypothetical protein GOBAR_AA32484 [Gossypium barbadense]